MHISTEFLFTIIKEVKLYYETPTIFVTQKDYADALFDALCTIRTAIANEDKEQEMNVIVEYHLQWLQVINELDNFKKVGISREKMYQAIRWSVDAIARRFKYFQRYMEKYRSSLSNDEQAYINAELEIVEDMHREVTDALLERLKCFESFVGDFEFKIKVDDAVEELLNWVDKIYDSLSTQLCDYVNLNESKLESDLTKTLKQIVDEFSTSNSPSSLKVIEDLKKKGKVMSSLIHSTTGHYLEINKVREKVYNLEDRIKRLNDEPTSAAVMALRHKKEYLEERLASLENLKTTVKTLHENEDVEYQITGEEDEQCVCEDFYRFRIFNHVLPLPEREKLVTELCYLFDLAINGERSSRKSIISILSAVEMKEEFTDDLGTFFIDEHSRKIYKIPDDDILYQPNELNALVQVSDDADHIYFYDECGRYFIDPKSRQRVYKAHASASEYMMDTSGVLLKIKEERDGKTFFYDNCGRYFINEDGKHIYREEDSASEYENDGLGNLVRIRSQADMFKLCPGDANVTEDFNYLKQTVGTALRSSIAECITHRPADPIKYLSCCLRKFRENMEIKEIRASEKEQLMVERELIAAEERAEAERAAMEAALLTHVGSEASYDSNILNYATTIPPESDNVSQASPK